MDRASLHQLLVKILAQAGKPQPELAESTFIHGGLDLDSLSLAGVLVELEQEFDITLLEDAAKIVTIGDLLNVLEQKIAASHVKKVA